MLNQLIGQSANASGDYSIALGHSANATVSQSVALGSNSKTTSGVTTKGVKVGNITYKGFVGDANSVLSVGKSDYNRQIQNVAAGQINSTSTDAVNGSQLYSVMEKLNSLSGNSAGANTTVKAADKNISISESTNTEGGKHYDVKLNNNISLGEKGKAGSIVITDGEDTKDAISVTKGTSDVNGKEKGRIVYADNEGNLEEVATLNDGMKYSGDNSAEEVISKKLNETVEIIGVADKTKLSEGNIGVNATEDGKLKVQLSKELKDLTSAEFKNGDKVTKITANGLDNGGNQITNVASGGDTDTNVANIGDIKRLVNVGKTEVKGDENFNITDKVNDKGHTEYNVKIADKVVIGSTEGSKVTIDGTKGTINGLTNKTWDSNNIVSGQAATEDQLKEEEIHLH
ncbi:hypothetical protein [Pseudostreptobacillus hongkongensis]|uniref:hypothetical protein n=1 Tax=Pseudostreptobacillus hongkongensis TaxID=1162717 RepID=UPI0028D3B99C|nr:hypothetical protein [Pseudostreptobacillus hongkongensis]